jgi:hypothetical protein
VALAAGFGLDFEHCDPEVFEAVEERLIQAERERKASALMADLRARMGRR